MNQPRLIRMTLWLSGIAFVIVYSVLIPLKLTERLPEHLTWLKVCIVPPLMLAILPTIVIVGARREKKGRATMPLSRMVPPDPS